MAIIISSLRAVEKSYDPASYFAGYRRALQTGEKTKRASDSYILSAQRRDYTKLSLVHLSALDKKVKEHRAAQTSSPMERSAIKRAAPSYGFLKATLAALIFTIIAIHGWQTAMYAAVKQQEWNASHAK